ncbi:SUN domain-containing protein 4-like [Punica granatum]|uniref:SUN domain-containing protein 4-like n=1 Tax=Punica granatum TaxID=22663 RepID=A0A6P8CN51_PUNGR|nr:SUN domain-containing protein 4-like [Punica granatum]XP_031385728.1 SUN domain-containing protein 4-like [Punica granatum]
MPRSVGAFLQRRAVDGASLPRLGPFLLVGLQCLALLLCSYTGYGDSNGGGAVTHRFLGDQMCGHEVEPRLANIPFALPNFDVCPIFHERAPYCVGPRSEICDIQVESKGELQDHFASTKEQGEGERKGDRISRDRPPKLDEFKYKAINPREKSVPGQNVSIMHRVEPSGVEYNYASASKGAKVLAYNKEAKGTSNILGKDMDKYLRNPCSAEVKFVIIELSEETLVCTIEIANFEHHSSNLKDFEVLGNLIYPTENWVKLGHFTAKKVKQSQRFTLKEPKWARYLKLDLLSHYGSEFYCTLSTVKVYGIDAVEHMLEDLISVQDHAFHPEESVEETRSTLPQPMAPQTDRPHQDHVSEGYSEPVSDDKQKQEADHVSQSGDQTRDIQPQPVGRVAGESVMKILMQKVRSLDVNLSILERYLQELNTRYGDLFKELDEEVAQTAMLLEKMRLDVMSLIENKEETVKDVADLVSWKSLVSSQFDILSRENEILRSQMERVTDFWVDLENKNIVVLLLTFMFGSFSAIKLVADLTVNTFRRKQNFAEFCKSKISWIFFLLNCATVALILLL